VGPPGSSSLRIERRRLRFELTRPMTLVSRARLTPGTPEESRMEASGADGKPVVERSEAGQAIDAPGDARKATAREWIGLAVIALPCLLYAMDLTVLNLAIPSLSVHLRPSSTELLWIIDIYGFLVAGSLITMGTLGDRIGRRRLLLIGAAAFGVASVLAAF